MASPFPNLRQHPLSGLSVRWAEVTGSTSTFDWRLGSEGVGVGMQIYVPWEDFQTAITEILGYSYRDPSGPYMRRIIPWQHPYFNQMYAKAITHVQGMRLEGTSVGPAFGEAVGPGIGIPANLGPWSDWQIVKLTIQFWRPPYYVRNDQSIIQDGLPREYLRYIDNDWKVSTQMLSKGVGSFRYVLGLDGGLNGLGFPGQVGQSLSHSKLTKRWYDVPAQCLFKQLPDGSCVGLPTKILYTTTATTNPITWGTGAYVYPPNSPMPGCVNAPLDGGVLDLENLRFFGMPTGTLRFDGVDFIPKPLQLPAAVMKIPFIAGTNEPVAQQQYDVDFHFDYFDPPRAKFENNRGHNLMPSYNNNLWTAVRTSQSLDLAEFPPFTTPFQYAVFQDMFFSL